jgi:hypothetical protein
MPNEHRIEKMKNFFKPGEKTEWGMKQLKSLNPFGRNAWGWGRGGRNRTKRNMRINQNRYSRVNRYQKV